MTQNKAKKDDRVTLRVPPKLIELLKDQQYQVRKATGHEPPYAELIEKALIATAVSEKSQELSEIAEFNPTNLIESDIKSSIVSFVTEIRQSHDAVRALLDVLDAQAGALIHGVEGESGGAEIDHQEKSAELRELEEIERRTRPREHFSDGGSPEIREGQRAGDKKAAGRRKTG
ncbi:MAG: hypothetical protein U0Q18_25455 [Bryobacteraceae bacterium]